MSCVTETRQLPGTIAFEPAMCIHCGACTAPCERGALRLDTSTWRLVHDDKQCIVCLRCVEACPLRLIRHNV